ncbi:MAG: hypothetical protein K2H19_05395 [Ruminococcus sp.]|nr:hypothetical protein [Ruminococcus sp.]
MTECSKSYDDIVVEIRDHFLKRDTEFTLEIPIELFSGFDDLRDMIADACNETDNPIGGDYLRWTARKISYGASIVDSTAVITVNVAYRTTAEQEAELDEKVTEILASLDFGSGSDYDKVKAIYDYVAENVSYNINGSDMKFSAYGAGIQGEAVCEGYSLLLYRLLMETGIKCRLIPGDAGGLHIWNMAEIDGVYYFMDITFDSMKTSNKHSFFLKGSNNFDKTHKFDVSDLIAVNSPYYYDYYKYGDFLSRFNISETDYDPLNSPATTSKTTTSTTITTTTTTTTIENTNTIATTGIIDDSSIHLLNKNPSVEMVGQKVFLFWYIDGYSNKELYSLTSDNEDVAIANAKNGITLVNEGSAEIEIVFKAESNGNTYYATKYLTVQAVPYIETTTVSTVTTKKSSVTTKRTTTTTTTTATEATSSKYEVTLLGDANCDGRLTIADATAIVQALGNHDEYALSAQGEKNADCFNIGDGVTGKDALSIQKLEAGIIKSLPETEE